MFFAVVTSRLVDSFQSRSQASRLPLLCRSPHLDTCWFIFCLWIEWLWNKKKFANQSGTVKLSSNLGVQSFLFPDGIRREKKPSRGFDKASLLGARSEVYMTKNKVGCFISCVWLSHGDLEVTPKMVQSEVVRWRCPSFWRPDMLRKGSTFQPAWQIFSLFFEWTASQGFSMVHCCAHLHLLLHHAVLTWEFTLNYIWSGHVCLEQSI